MNDATSEGRHTPFFRTDPNDVKTHHYFVRQCLLSSLNYYILSLYECGVPFLAHVTVIAIATGNHEFEK